MLLKALNREEYIKTDNSLNQSRVMINYKEISSKIQNVINGVSYDLPVILISMEYVSKKIIKDKYKIVNVLFKNNFTENILVF